jgi:hypothetical protein
MILLECFECWEAYLRSLKVFRVQKHLTWGVRVFKGTREVRRCLQFKSIWLECFEYLRVYLRGEHMFRVQKHLILMFWMCHSVLKRLGGVWNSKTSSLSV